MSNTDIIFPKKGYARATEILCIPPSDTKFTSADTITWYFGDGESETKTKNTSLSTTHTYLLKGNYIISAVARLSSTAETYTTSASCSIVNYIDYSLSFVTIPPPTIPGHYTQFPYKIIFTSPDIITEPIINLYAQFSRSYPPQFPKNKWSFLRPEWRFVDLSGKDIEAIKPNYSSVKINKKGEIDPTGITVGLTGTAEFYFVDDLYNIDTFVKDAPTPIIWASTPTSAINYYKDTDSKSGEVYSYSTTDIRTYAPYTAYFKIPDYLTITENKIQDINFTKWVGAPIPFFISSHVDSSALNVKPYNPEYNFVKYLPYALSAQGSILVPCAQDLRVDVSFTTPVSASFDNPSNVSSQGEYYFIQTDEYGYTSPGFARGSVTVHQEDYTRLYAETTIDYAKLGLSSVPIFAPYIWIPNPSAGTLSIIYYTGALNPQFIEALKNQYSTNFTSNIFTPVATDINTTQPYNGLYAVASVPGTEPTFNYYAWIADADLNCIHKYNPSGDITHTIYLSSISADVNHTPVSLSVDSDKNLWVGCYDSGFIYKFNENGDFLLSIDSSSLFSQNDPGIPGMFRADNTDIFKDGQLLQPTYIETDLDSNLWVTFSNILSGKIVKFSSTGDILVNISAPPLSTPQSLVIDSQDNSVWIALTYESNTKNSRLQKYSSSGALLFNENVEHLSYMTLDMNHNLWFIYKYNKIGRVFANKDSVDVVNFIVQSKNPIIDVPLPSSLSTAIENSILEGIGCNDKNLLFIIHSAQNSIYVLDPVSETYIDNIKIRPHQNKGIYNDLNAEESLYRERNISIAVAGDWTGARWGQKYHSYNFGTKTISGLSNELKILGCNLPDVRKHNQDFNMAAQLSSIALVPLLENNNNLFNNFFKSIYGTSRNIDDTGTSFYEKIANFLSNTKDIDTCEIDNLYDLADMLDVVVEDYRLAYPAQLKHLMNLLSITHRKLWGIRCKCNSNFAGTSNCTLTDICKICGKCKELNRGKKLDYSHVEEGVPVVIYDRKYNSYFLHYPSTINNLSIYPVEMLTAIGLDAPIADNYYFYEYIPTAVSSYTEGVIDWENPYTTLNPLLSTFGDWTREGGMIDELLSLQLYRGLNLVQYEPVCTPLPTPTPTPTPSITPTQTVTPTIPPTPSFTSTPTLTLTPTPTKLTIDNGYVFFADVNWMSSVNTAPNRKACYELFRIFFNNIKHIQYNNYVNVHNDPYYGINLAGSKRLSTLHDALDPQGYTFSPVDITKPGAHLLVNSPFVMNLQSPIDAFLRETYGSVFNSIVVDNLQNIARSHPIIVIGEWGSWINYDNYFIQKVTNHTPSELFAAGDLIKIVGTERLPDSFCTSSHRLGSALIDAGVTVFDNDAIAWFSGTRAEEYAFAKADGKPSMLVIPFRGSPPKPSQTATATNTPTPTITKSNTQTPTITNSNTPTLTQTNSNTPTPTLSPTATPTVTVTRTATRTPTPTISLTQTLTPSPSITLPPLSNRTTIAIQIVDRTLTALNGEIAFAIAKGRQTSTNFSSLPSANKLYNNDKITFTGPTNGESCIFIVNHNGIDVSGYARDNRPVSGERLVASLPTPNISVGGIWGTYSLYMGILNPGRTQGITINVYIYEVDHSNRRLTRIQTILGGVMEFSAGVQILPITIPSP